MKKETLGTILAIAAAVVSGISIPANKVFAADLDPAVFTAIRALIIGTVFLFLSLWQFKFDFGRFRKVSWKYMFAIAVVGGAFAFLLFFSGLKLTTAGRAAFLHKTLPLYVAMLAFVFLREKITKKYMYAMLLMFAGTVIISFAAISPAEMWSNPQLGDLLVISATVLWAVENVIARKAMLKGGTNFIVSFSRMFFGGLILFGFVVLTQKTGALTSLTTVQMTNIAISTALLFAYVLFYYWSLRLINVSKAALFLLMAPVISLAIGIALLGEPAPMLQIAGSGVILIGAYLATGMKSEERGV